MRGFSLIEILVVLAIFALLLVVSFAGLTTLRSESDLDAEARNFARILEFARNKTIASESAAQYGVYVNTGTAPHQYVLFQGTDYASRQVSEDEIYEVRDAVEFGTVSFAGGSEVVFQRIQGDADQIGSAVFRLKSDPSRVRTVYVEGSGTVSIDAGAAPDDTDRVKDTRHVHIDYSGRIIDAMTENLVLDFGTVTETIPLAGVLSGGQIVWEGTVEVGGEDQTVRMHTHTLNNGNDSQFSMYRDRRFNTKPLTITLSGDSTGKLIEYDADGVLIIGGESIYVVDTEAQ